MQVLFPIFLKLSVHAKVTFWSRLFEKMARGEMPHCVYIKNASSVTILQYSHPKRGFTYYIDDEKDSSVLYTEIEELFKKNIKTYGIVEKISDGKLDPVKSLKKNFVKNYIVIKHALKTLKTEDSQNIKKYVTKTNLLLCYKAVKLPDI